MSRSGYTDDCYGWDAIRYRGQVASALRGKRGQALLRDLLAGLDVLPEKKLITGDLVRDGQYCAIGAAGFHRGVEMSNVDPEDAEKIAFLFDIADPFAREVMWINDEAGDHKESPEARYIRVRDWVVNNLSDEKA